MNRQVITIGVDGRMSGLQVKPGKGVDLRQFGEARINRASDVQFDEDVQKWFVLILRGKHAGTKLSNAMMADAVAHQEGYSWKTIVHRDDGVAYFDEYDDAVWGEITFFNALRLREGADACD